MKKPVWKKFIIPVLVVLCALAYYFGELADWAAWESVRSSFFYSVHDIHRLLFLAPIILAGYTARVKGALIITLVSFIIFLPRAFFISPYPDPLLRMVIFTVFAGVIGTLVGIIRNQAVRARRLEAAVGAERDKLVRIVDGVADGIIITGPDYRIRFMNSKMVEAFGDGMGITCHKHLYNRDTPCGGDCRIENVISKREVGKWECELLADRTWEVVAAPYIDADGTACQVSIFRDSSRRTSA